MQHTPLSVKIFIKETHKKKAKVQTTKESTKIEWYRSEGSCFPVKEMMWFVDGRTQSRS